MEIRIDCDYDEETSIFSSKVRIFLPKGEVMEHTLEKWRLSGTEKHFGQHCYTRFLLTSLQDEAVSLMIGCDPEKAAERIIHHHNMEIRKFLIKIAKRYGCRPGFPDCRPIKFGFTVGTRDIPFHLIKPKT